MKRKIKYTSEPLGDFQIVKDFLPKPDELVLEERTVRVTLQLNKSTVEHFKKLAGDKNDYLNFGFASEILTRRIERI